MSFEVFIYHLYRSLSSLTYHRSALDLSSVIDDDQNEKKKHPSLRERHWSKIHPYLRKYQEIRPMSTYLYKTYPCLRIMIRISLIYGFSNIYTKIWCCEVEIASWWIIAFYNYRCLSATITQIIVFHHWKVDLE